MKNPDITYIANIRLPTERAHGIQIMKMCEAFAGLGLSVELLVPRRRNDITEDAFSYYGVSPSFSIRYLPTLDLVHWGFWGFLAQSLTFAFSVLFVSFRRGGLFYAREEFAPFFLSFFRKRIVWETHTNRYNLLIKRVLKKSEAVICITEALARFYREKGIAAATLFVAPDGVDISLFEHAPDEKTCRAELEFPQDKKIILYTGHLYAWKGVGTLAKAASLFGDDTVFVFVGGMDDDIASFKKEFGGQKNIRILGRKSYTEMPAYMQSADVLVLPNSAREPISRLYTSPLKLFEYMAVGKPIVASDLPSIREIVNEENAVLVRSDDAEALAEGIRRALDRSPGACAQKNKEAVRGYAWHSRAEGIWMRIKTRSRRVLFLIDSLKKIGGAEQMFVDQANYFAKRGIDVFFATVVPHAEPGRFDGELRIGRPVAHFRFRSAFDIREHLNLRAYVREHHIGIIYSYLDFSNTVARLYKLLAPTRRVVIVEPGDPRRKSSIARLFDRFANLFVYKIFAMGGAVRAHLLAYQPMYARKIHAMRNGVHEMLRGEELTKKLKQGRREPLELLHVGNMASENKGHAALIDLMAALKERQVSARLTFVGDGHLRQTLEAHAREEGVEERVVFAGIVPHESVKHYYAEADIFLFNSRTEGGAASIMEATSAGLPVVTSDFQGVEEVVENGKTGIIVRRDDIEGFADGIVRLQKDERAFANMARAARELYEERFAYAPAAERFIEELFG